MPHVLKQFFYSTAAADSLEALLFLTSPADNAFLQSEEDGGWLQVIHGLGWETSYWSAYTADRSSNYTAWCKINSVPVAILISLLILSWTDLPHAARPVSMVRVNLEFGYHCAIGRAWGIHAAFNTKLHTSARQWFKSGIHQTYWKILLDDAKPMNKLQMAGQGQRVHISVVFYCDIWMNIQHWNRLAMPGFQEENGYPPLLI